MHPTAILRLGGAWCVVRGAWCVVRGARACGDGTRFLRIPVHGPTPHGTCVDQCLSNTRLLTEYFTSGEYLYDINTSPSSMGMAGCIAVDYAELMQEMWAPTAVSALPPRRLKTTLGRYKPQVRRVPPPLLSLPLLSLPLLSLPLLSLPLLSLPFLFLPIW